MNNLHQKLIRKYQSYNNWHQTKHHNKIHWGVLVVFALIGFGLILNLSNQIYAQADITPPSVPGNPLATPVSSSQINLSWTASTDNVGVTGYKIYRCDGSGCTPTTQIATSATNSYSNIGLTASTAYIYTVSAYDAAGNESGKTAAVIVTTQMQTGVNITGVSGTSTNGSTITVTGTGFGTNGPTIVIFDDFESGTNGNIIKSGDGSATIGKWDITGNGGNDPKYSNSHALSGTLAFRGDATKDNVSVAARYITATSDIFVSYWYYFPSTSDWPCYNNTNCNNKMVWITGINTAVDDRVIPASLPTDKNTNINYLMFGNGAIDSTWFSPFDMSKGKWYRFWVYLHGEGTANDHEELWVASPSSEGNISVTKKVDRSSQIWPSGFAGFKRAWVNAFQRWCNDCSESAPTFDDVYIATGVGARARIEIGDAATYTASKKLTIATVNLWDDTSITATIRQGSFTDGQTAYLYAVDANGNVNETGYPVTVGGMPFDTQAPTTPTNLTAAPISSSQINFSWTASTDDVEVTGYKIYRCTGSACTPTTLIATSATNSYSNTGLTASTAYTYAISAYDVAGNESIKSALANAITQAQTGINITGVSGTLTHGSTVTIDGNGFGTKTMAAPWRWDPFDGISQYSALSNNETIPYSSGGYWDGNPANLLKYNTDAETQRGVSTANAESAIMIGTDTANIKLTTTLPDSVFSNETYISYWIWHSTTLTSADNTKTLRYWNNSGGTYRLSLQDSWASNGPWNIHRYDNGVYCYNSSVFPGNFVRPIGGEWERVELYLKQETTPDTSDDGEILVAQTANGRISTFSKVNFDESCGGFTGRLRWMTFGYDNNNPGRIMGIILDDIYIDNTRTRVEIGDAPTWNANTHREIQIPSAWSDTSIAININQGSFSNLNSAYLYIIDANGNVNTNGYPLSGGSGDTQVPSVPANLTVNSVSSSQINLSWTASTDDLGVTGYKIYRCAGSACAPTVQIATSATNSYPSTGLTASTAYTYAVSAYDAAGNESGKSSSISATTLAGFKPSDLNQDQKVDQQDFDILKQDWKRTDKPKSDLNQDGIVDSRDLGILMSEWTR